MKFINRACWQKVERHDDLSHHPFVEINWFPLMPSRCWEDNIVASVRVPGLPHCQPPWLWQALGFISSLSRKIFPVFLWSQGRQSKTLPARDHNSVNTLTCSWGCCTRPGWRRGRRSWRGWSLSSCLQWRGRPGGKRSGPSGNTAENLGKQVKTGLFIRG